MITALIVLGFLALFLLFTMALCKASKEADEDLERMFELYERTTGKKNGHGGKMI